MRAVEGLIAEVRDPRSREHFAEAARAYGAGAYRAAIISTWVTGLPQRWLYRLDLLADPDRLHRVLGSQACRGTT